MNKDFPIAVLISGRGSNLAKLLENQSNYWICAVLSNKSDAPGLEIARQWQVPTFSFDRNTFDSLADQKEAIFQKLREINPRLICLAGYMQIITQEHAREFFGRLVNIHPSLLPDFPGTDTHRRVIESKATNHGCTVHYIDEGVDTGPIIAQASLACAANESEELLAERVLVKEHLIYPWVVNQIALNAIQLQGRTVTWSAAAQKSAAEFDFFLASHLLQANFKTPTI